MRRKAVPILRTRRTSDSSSKMAIEPNAVTVRWPALKVRSSRNPPCHLRRARNCACQLGQPSDRAKSRDAGFDVHMVKPVEPATIQALFEGGREEAVTRSGAKAPHDDES
jgi:hypothetical protein